MAEAGELLKDTVTSLKTAVEQVADVAATVQTVVDDVAVLTEQVPELDLRSIFADIQKFSQQLASINLVEPINGSISSQQPKHDSFRRTGWRCSTDYTTAGSFKFYSDRIGSAAVYSNAGCS